MNDEVRMVRDPDPNKEQIYPFSIKVNSSIKFN